MKTNLFNIQRFCNHDGDGLRTVVFFKGCPLNCRWCHNPEGKSHKNQLTFYKQKCIHCKQCQITNCGVHLFIDGNHHIDYQKCNHCGRCVALCPTKALVNSLMVLDTKEIIEIVKKDIAFYQNSGGLTVSGGEPFAQKQALLALLKEAKRNHIHTAIETCGYFDISDFEQFKPYIDLLLWDYKDSNDLRHQKNVGVSTKKIISNLIIIDQYKIPIRLRCILLKGINCNKEHALSILKLAKKLKNIQGIDLIPYHPEGKNKYEQLGLANDFDDKKYIPTKNDISLFQEILKDYLKI